MPLIEAEASHAGSDIQKRYRPEIEGLRIVAALLVALYHTWSSRVSGGVDVFFVVSGFLVTTSLVARYRRDNAVGFRTFALGLLKRLLPNALIVLLFVSVVGFFVVPEVRHSATIRELLASLFYYENWQLAVTGTDYLDQGNAASPVQHFWAMSIQGQFYIALFLVVLVSHFIARRIVRRPEVVLGVVFATVLVSSLAFSVHLTRVDQPWAYFDTRTRLWEFMVGGLLALVIFRTRLSPTASRLLGWGGLVILVSTGLLVDVGGSFPGYVALVPVGAAVMILLAGQHPTRWGVGSLLGSAPMVLLGGYSYGFYLWHWPLLSFTYVVYDTEEVGLLHGAALILMSLGLSIVSTTLVERWMLRSVAEKGFNPRGFRPILILAVVVLVAITSWFVVLRWHSHVLLQQAGSRDHPGAMAMMPGFPAVEEVDPVPALVNIKDDKAAPYFDGCHQQKGSTDVVVCEYGVVADYEYTVAIVGGSKSAHWLPSVESFAADEQIRVLSVTKSGCRLSLEEVVAEDCTEWNRHVGETLSQYSPDLVISLADTADPEVDGVPQGFLDQFADLHARGFSILAIRDTPQMPWDVPECLNSAGIRSGECDAGINDVLSPLADWEALEDPPDYVDYADYTRYLCTDEECPAVVGNVVAYIDKSHMSATFSRSFGPIVRQDVMRVLRRDS